MKQLKHYRNIIIVISLIMLVFSGCSSEEKTEGYKTYENDSYDLSIIYPEDWNVSPKDNRDGTGPIVVFQPPAKDSLMVCITLFTEKLPDSIENAEEYFNYSKKMTLSQAINLNILQEGNEAINGQDTHWAEFTFNRRVYNTKSLTCAFLVDGRGYIISSLTTTELYDDLEPIFEKVSHSIKFN